MPIKPLTLRYVFSSVHAFVACGGGAGLLKPAPGTWGSFIAVPLFMLLFNYEASWYVLLTEWCILFGLGCWACSRTGLDTGVVDHGSVVWDEMAAVWLIFILTPITMSFSRQMLAVLIFRVFDIWKPFPCGWIDRSLKTGLGVMLDDVFAALYTLLILRLLMLFPETVLIVLK